MTIRARDRWQRRPYVGACVRFVVVASPVAAAVVALAIVVRALPAGDAAAAGIVRWSLAAAAAAAAFVATDRAARRLLPLAVLLRLSLAFPAAAPSRVAVARSAANLRDLEERVRIARATELGGDDAAAAAAMLLGLVAASEAHDRGTRGHSERVLVYTDLLARQLHLYEADRDRLRWAALLHDVGKLQVPRSVLNKPGPLEPGELEIVRRHPDESARLTRPLHAWLGEWADAIGAHHERWDGRGYPQGSAGSEISLGARIIAVADCYETMTAARPYHRPKSPAAARQELVACSGTQFDPGIVQAFLEVSVLLDRRRRPASNATRARFASPRAS